MSAAVMQNTNDLVTTAYVYLKDQIVNCQFAPGQSIVENEVSQALSISRTPVRSALRLLENEKLVRLVPNKGAFVTEVSTTDIEELFEYRILLEARALKNYIQFATDAQIDQFIDLFKSHEGMENFSEEYHAVDADFHMSIVHYIRNTRMLDTYYQLCDQIDRLRHFAALDPSRVVSTPQEHLDILNWIKARDFEHAEQALVQHLEAVKLSVINSFRNVYVNMR